MAKLATLPARYPHRRALLIAARAEGSNLSLFVPGAPALSVGAEVKVEVTLGDSPLKFSLQGRVHAQVAAHAGRPESGLSIAFVADEKRKAAEMLAQCAGRSAEHGTALDARHEVEVSCVVELPGEDVKAALRDVSNTGAFVNTSKRSGLKRDQELTLRVNPLFGSFGGKILKARVVWVGEKKGVPGFGVRFLDTKLHVRESLKKHLEAAR